MKKIISFVLFLFLLTLFVVPSFAQTIAFDKINATASIGKITTITQAFIWVFNALRWFGWAGVIVGVGMAIFGLIYKLINSESEDAMKKVQSYVTKAVLIVVAGILLISSGFIVTQVAALFGIGIAFDLNATPGAVVTPPPAGGGGGAVTPPPAGGGTPFPVGGKGGKGTPPPAGGKGGGGGGGIIVPAPISPIPSMIM